MGRILIKKSFELLGRKFRCQFLDWIIHQIRIAQFIEMKISNNFANGDIDPSRQK